MTVLAILTAWSALSVPVALGLGALLRREDSSETVGSARVPISQ